MAKRKRKPKKIGKPDDWQRSAKPILARGGVGHFWRYTWRGQYRISHYTAYGELPFLAFARRGVGFKSGWEYLGRFATLVQAKRACKLKPQQNGRPQFNELGDVGA